MSIIFSIWAGVTNSANSVLLGAPHLPLHAETPSIVDDALAHPSDGLGGSIWGVAEDGQGRRMDGGFANTVDS